MLFKLLEKFQPFLEADDGTDISGVDDGDFADLQDDDDVDTGLEDQDAADPESTKDMSFKDDPRNKEYADKRRKEELEAVRIQNQKLAKDYEIAKKYGAEYNVFSEEDIAAQFGASHGITNLAQFEKALQDQEYQKAGIDPGLLDRILEDRLAKHPLMQLAKQQHLDTTINTQFERLKKQVPECGLNSLEDLAALPTYQQIIEKIGRGYSMTAAYLETNFDTIRTKSNAAAKQKTLNDINSKQHLNTEGDGEGETNDVHISADTLQMYIDSGMTKKEAMKFHKKLYG